MTKITLIRHGETAWNADGRWQGHAPVPLNEAGFEQARQAAAHLASAGITRIISSDLLRTRQTAHVIAERLGLPVSLDRRLREVDVGDWQGLTTIEIDTWDGENFARYRSLPHPQRAFPGGESVQMLEERGQAAIMDISVSFPGEHVLVVAHGGTIRAIVRRLAQYDEDLPLGNCTITRVFLRETQTWHMDCFGLAGDKVVW